MSIRDFSEQLNEKLIEPLSFQTYANWENGTVPSYRMLLPFALHYTDWRRDFGLDCLAALAPEHFDPVTNIGKEKIDKEQ